MKLLLLLLFVLFLPFSNNFPSERAKELSKRSTQKEKATENKEKCYFSVLRKNDLEKKERPEKSTVSLKCSGDLKDLDTVAKSYASSSSNVENPIALLLCRGAGQCDANFDDPKVYDLWKNKKICEHHANELLLKWDVTDGGFRDQHMYRRKGLKCCSMPDDLEPHATRPDSRLYQLSVKGASAILKEKNVLVHPGIPICRKHQTFVESLISGSGLPTKKAKLDVYDSDSEEDVCYPEPLYHQPVGHHVDPVRKSFLRFAHDAGVTRVCTRKPWEELEMTTKERKARAARNLIETMLELMVPDKTGQFREMVEKKFLEMDAWATGSSEDLDAIMDQITAHYVIAEDRKTRHLILSIAANSVSYAKVQTYIPGLTSHMYYKAKRFARRKRRTQVPKKTVLEKYNRLAVEAFIEFFTSPLVMIGLPSGSRYVKTTKGAKVEIPDSIRQQTATEIIEMFTQICEDNNRKDLLPPVSTMYKILEACAATKREATTCVDYFVGVGMEAFDALHRILDEWKRRRLFDADTIDEMKRLLFEAAQYYRTDLRLHVKNFSRVADHCANFALSDPDNAKLASSCSNGPEKHIHDMKCERCERAHAILEKIESHAKEFVEEEKKTGDKSTLEQHQEELEMILLYKKDILEMKKHYVRAAVANQELQNITRELKDNQAIITLDFAQKFIPKWHREKQADYYGKKGISYHVAHITARVGTTYVDHSFVHIYDGAIAQDSPVVVLTVAHILKQLKMVGINKVFLRSDNAGAYHCASTIGSLHWLQTETKMEIGSYSFSEAQNGKGPSDRDASRVKRVVKEYINQGHDVVTSSQFFKALKEKTPNGMSVFHGSVVVESDSDTKYPGIANLNYFSVESKGIRARRYGDIGEGILIEKAELSTVKGTFSFDDAGSLASKVDSKKEREAVLKGLETSFWYHSKCVKTATCVKEPDQDVNSEMDDEESRVSTGDLFQCPEPGCSSTFLKAYNLEQHLLNGKHKISPERMTERDYALNFYSRKLEEVTSTSSCPVVGAAAEKMKELKISERLTVGWALPDKKTRKPYGKNVIDFLTECYKKGEANKRPMNPVTVSELMRTMKKSDGSRRFTTDELKSPRQIASYFSRLAEKNRQRNYSTQSQSTTQSTVQQGSSNRHRRSGVSVSTEENEEYNYKDSDDEHEDAGLIRFINSEEFWTEEDEVFNVTMHKKTSIFSDKF